MGFANLGILAAFARARRVPRRGFNILNTKRAPRGFYKGKGAQATGHHTKMGRYRILQDKLPKYVVPDLTGFKVRRWLCAALLCSSEGILLNAALCCRLGSS